MRRATQRNAGRMTAVIDGEVALTSPDRMQLAVKVHRDVASWQPGRSSGCTDQWGMEVEPRAWFKHAAGLSMGLYVSSV
ncbi:hypothetical protein [Nocardia gamkensis]|uniref:hypothetical protein n=1 Tax=Nocardia gamkensis TaxID=352869 RepID=UPI0037C522F3